MKKEIQAFENAMSNPKRPLVAVVGGARCRASWKCLKICWARLTVIIGGGMMFTFVKGQGKEVGKSLVEDDLIDTAKDILAEAAEKKVQFLLPVDCVVASEFKGGVPTQTVAIDSIPADQLGLDIGPATVAAFYKVIENAGTIVWSGLMGVFE